jgi:hypothetical protein
MTSFFCYSYLHLGKNSPWFALAARASIAITGHGSIHAPVLLLVATGVAIVVVVAFTPALFVAVVCAWFIMHLVARIGMALFVCCE